MIYSIVSALLIVLPIFVSGYNIQAYKRSSITLGSTLKIQCDDKAQVERSDDGGKSYTTLIEIPEWKSWDTVETFQLSDVSTKTVLRFRCVNDGGIGGMMAEVDIPGIDTYATQPGGLFKVGGPSAKANSYSLTYAGKEQGWPAGTGSAFGPNTKWMSIPSNTGINFYFRFRRVFSQLPYQDELDARYGDFEWDQEFEVEQIDEVVENDDQQLLQIDGRGRPKYDVKMKVQCDDKATVERSDDGGKSYRTLIESSEWGSWSTIRDFDLADVIKKTTLRFTCHNSGGGPGGMMAQINMPDGRYFTTQPGSLFKIGKKAAQAIGYTADYREKASSGWPAGTGSQFSAGTKWIFVPGPHKLNFYFRFRRVFGQLPFEDEMDAKYGDFEWQEYDDYNMLEPVESEMVHVAGNMNYEQEQYTMQQMLTITALPLLLLATGVVCYKSGSRAKEGEYKTLIQPNNV